jgi:branched-chain amino acid transport system ATP-binding protein
LHGISLSVKAGSIVTLIGSNGAGKSTTLRAISGLVKPQSGEIFYAGQNIAGLPAHQIVRLGLSQVPEGRMVFANLTVHENLMMGAYLQHDKAVIRASRNGRSKSLAPSPAANSRCWPSVARS